MERPIVDRGESGFARAGGYRDIPWHEIRQWPHCAVRRISDGIAHRRRTEERPHDIGSRRCSVIAERQAKIVRMLLEPEPFISNIKQSAHAEGRIDTETGQLTTRFRELQLEQIIGKARDEADVIEKTTDALANRNRRDVGITLRDRMKNVMVQLEVEPEHLFVEGSQRVAVGLRILAWRMRRVTQRHDWNAGDGYRHHDHQSYRFTHNLPPAKYLISNQVPVLSNVAL